jgi:hypothetical protein
MNRLPGGYIGRPLLLPVLTISEDAELDIPRGDRCWKTESASEWAFQDGVTYGWIPQPLWDKPATLG